MEGAGSKNRKGKNKAKQTNKKMAYAGGLCTIDSKLNPVLNRVVLGEGCTPDVACLDRVLHKYL